MYRSRMHRMSGHIGFKHEEMFPFVLQTIQGWCNIDWAQVKGIFHKNGFWGAFAFFCFLKGGCYIRGLKISRGFGSGKNRSLQKLWLRKNWLVLGTWCWATLTAQPSFSISSAGWDETKLSMTMKVTCLTLHFFVLWGKLRTK